MPPTDDPRTVVVIDVDSLRPDHVGAYGYDPPTTPNLDALAAEAVRFERAYAASSPCMPSRAALSTGRYGISNGVATHRRPGQQVADPGEEMGFDGDHDAYRRLPEVCFDARIRTCGVSSFPRHPAPWFYHLFEEFHQPREPEGDGEYFQTARAATVTDRALDCLDRSDGEDLFLYAQYWDPHAPYNRAPDEVERFADPPRPPHPTDEQLAAHQDDTFWRCARQQGIADAEDLLALLAGYDAEINYCDRHVGRLLDGLREQGRYEDALVVVVADHGEEFGEHGLYREHWSVHEGTQRIPLVVRPPGGADGSAREHLVTNVDVAPTVVDYLDLPRPAGWHGRSLRPVVESPDADWRDRVVLDHGLYTAQRAVRTDRWKLVRTYHDGIWELPDRQLFDCEADPWEQDDVADDHPDVVETLSTERAVWADRYRGHREDALRAVAREGPAGLEWADADAL